MILQVSLQLLHFGFEDTPEERQYPCIEKQNEYEIYKNGSTYDGAYKADNCNREQYKSEGYNDSHHHHPRGPDDEKCMYKESTGTCIITSIEYNNTVDDSLNIFMQFKPTAAKMKDSDVRTQLLIEDDNPSDNYLKKHNIYFGQEVKCVKRTLRKGHECYRIDWLFPELDLDRKGGTFIKDPHDGEGPRSM
ncbi:Conserved_hypothetical protein [Hexamita inflata]|uniref:Uncharacterized protein n=1 Tax=Hexamita inflata TaxID=28002 RepID=A0AA86PYL6_9EUKA|nr:Conserved hypothetical protein [Hexamita inflata]CAI9930567.1 Conserved hypothetical protein [Hexamita inflata]CAI9948765.1 Conserved hypothetical protein [Hexamita inflata]